MTRRNLATELSELERLASHRQVDLAIARRREPVAHWAIEAREKFPPAPYIPFSPPDPNRPVEHPVVAVTEVTFLDAISKMVEALAGLAEKREPLARDDRQYDPAAAQEVAGRSRASLEPGRDSRGGMQGDGGVTPKVPVDSPKVKP